jgi:hypothetical protein
MAAVAGTVSAGVAPPVVKAVEDAVAAQAAESRARSSVTVMAPMGPAMVEPGAPAPRFALTGAVIESAPTVTVKVTVVSGSPGAGLEARAFAVTAAEAAVEVSTAPMMAATLRTQNIDFFMDLPREAWRAPSLR